MISAYKFKKELNSLFKVLTQYPLPQYVHLFQDNPSFKDSLTMLEKLESNDDIEEVELWLSISLERTIKPMIRDYVRSKYNLELDEKELPWSYSDSHFVKGDSPHFYLELKWYEPIKIEISKKHFTNKNALMDFLKKLYEQFDEGIRKYELTFRIVNDLSEVGPGPIKDKDFSFAGICIGDSLEKVKTVLGEPTRELIHSNQYTTWYYEEFNISVTFYTVRTESELYSHVLRITVNYGSPVKTNKGFGIGDKIEEVAKAFRQLHVTEPSNEGVQNIWINGTIQCWDVFYPSLQISLQNDVISSMVLEEKYQNIYAPSE